jgi:hypothetical protein
MRPQYRQFVNALWTVPKHPQTYDALPLGGGDFCGGLVLLCSCFFVCWLVEAGGLETLLVSFAFGPSVRFGPLFVFSMTTLGCEGFLAAVAVVYSPVGFGWFVDRVVFPFVSSHRPCNFLVVVVVVVMLMLLLQCCDCPAGYWYVMESAPTSRHLKTLPPRRNAPTSSTNDWIRSPS